MTERAAVTYRGITATVEISDSEDDERYVVIKCLIDPPPRGLDREAYSRMQKAAWLSGEDASRGTSQEDA